MHLHRLVRAFVSRQKSHVFSHTFIEYLPGESPKPSNDTMVCLSSYTSQGSSGWKSDFLPVTGTRTPDGLKVDLWIFTPADCVVSDWKFSLHSIYRAEMDMATVTYEHPEKIYILFNPWNKSETMVLILSILSLILVR